MFIDGASSVELFDDDRLTFNSMTQKEERKRGVSRVRSTTPQLMAALIKMQYRKKQGTTMGHCCLIINKIVVYLHLQ